jgi:hypothetical protein
MKHFGVQTLTLVSLLLSSLLYNVAAVAPQRSTEQTSASSSQVASTKDSTQNCPDADQLRKNVQQLTAEVQRLRSRVAILEKDRLATTIQEQLEKEEQRGESLQLHLLQIADKEAPLQARLDQVNQQLKPEALEQLMAGVGSVHPEDAREEVRKRLSNEKVRIQSQLDLFRQDRVRTQASLATTDAAIQRLKQKLAEALR